MERGLLRFHERHVLRRPADTIVRDHDVELRRWTRRELRTRLVDAGLTGIDIRDGVGRQTNDRLLCVASR